MHLHPPQWSRYQVRREEEESASDAGFGMGGGALRVRAPVGLAITRALIFSRGGSSSDSPLSLYPLYGLSSS